MSKKTEEKPRKANCFIEEDLYQKIKREAKHQADSPQKLLNQHLRDYFSERSKVKKQKKTKEKQTAEICPHCDKDIHAKISKKEEKKKGPFSKIFGQFFSFRRDS